MKEIRGLIIIVISLLGLVSCIPKATPIDESIISITKLTINEPSGLSYSIDGNSLLCVSDRGTLHNISFDGSLLKNYSVSLDDLEGVSVNQNEKLIYVVQEQKGLFNVLNSSGAILSSTKILDNNDNNGLEGISYDSDRNVLYMLKEKNPGLLIKYSLDTKTQQIINLTFALDYSGIYYNEKTDYLWILSDESQTLNKCDTNGRLIDSYYFPFSGMEGVVVSEDETEAFIVADPSNTLFRVKIN